MTKARKTKKVQAQVEQTELNLVEVPEEGTQDVVLNETQANEFETQKTISAKIRYLNSQSFSRSAIARFMGKKYQHVRNVLETPLKRPVAEVKL